MFGNKFKKIIMSIFCLVTSLNVSLLGTYQYLSNEVKHELLRKINAGIPAWMTKQIALDLADAHKTGITLSMIEQTMDQDPNSIAKFTIKNGKISLSTRNNINLQPYCQQLVYTLEELSSFVKLPDVIFLFNTDDAPYNRQNLIENNIPPISKARYISPVFAPTKHIHDKNVVLMPDIHTMHFARYPEETLFGKQKYPWETKKAQALWRGSTTGGHYNLQAYTKFPRFKLVQLSAQHPKILDAKFAGQIANEVKPLFTTLGYIGNSISILDHMQYKYQILIDGNSSSWSRCYWQLLSNSVMLKQNSVFIQWYHDILKPYVHYIPFDYYCSDLIKKISWAQNNDNKVQEIIKNANQIVEHNLQYSDMLLYLYAVITNYAKLQKFKP